MPAISDLTILDYAVFTVLILSTLLSLFRGGVREALGLASWIGAAYVAFRFFEQVRPHTAQYIENELIADVVTAIGLFLVPLIVFKIIAGIIANAVSDGPLGGIDRLLGLIFGAARGALIVVAAWLFAGQVIPEDKLPVWVKDAFSRQYLDEGAQWAKQYLPDGFLEETGETAGSILEGADTLQNLREVQPSDTEAPAEGAPADSNRQ